MYTNSAVTRLALVVDVSSDDMDSNLMKVLKQVIIYSEIEAQNEVRKLLEIYKALENPTNG